MQEQAFAPLLDVYRHLLAIARRNCDRRVADDAAAATLKLANTDDGGQPREPTADEAA